MRDPAARQIRVLGIDPGGKAKGAGVLQCTQQTLGIDDRAIGIGKTNTTGFGQLRHLGDHFALQAQGQSADWIKPGTRQLLRAMLEHLNQTGLIQWRISVGRTSERSHATTDRGEHLGLERGLVFKTGFAQSRRQINQAWRYD